MSDQRRQEPLDPELQREDARGPDGGEGPPETGSGQETAHRTDGRDTQDQTAAGRDEEWHEEHEVGPRGESYQGDVSHQPEEEGIERFNRVKEEPGPPAQPEASDPPDTSVRQPGMGPSDSVQFDQNENVPPRETQQGAPVPAFASGMFFPVIILLIVAVVIILWLAL